MPRAYEPHSPEIDIAARRAAATDAVLTPELEDFCQSGLSVVIGVCAPGEAPIAGIGCGCRILPDGRMRLFLMRSHNPSLLAVVERGGGVAATFSWPITHRSIQIKGSRAAVAEPDDEDRDIAVMQHDRLRRDLVEINYSPAFSAAYCRVDPHDIVAIDFTPEAAFAQTPGPGAGAELKP
ncbi:MAG: hypothetical protein WAU86_11845 [Oricola sp.]